MRLFETRVAFVASMRAAFDDRPGNNLRKTCFNLAAIVGDEAQRTDMFDHYSVLH